MTKGYVFKAGAQQAITKIEDGSNLPKPKVGAWEFVKVVDDVNKPGLIGFDPDKFEKQGYQIWPDEGFLGNADVLGTPNILK